MTYENYVSVSYELEQLVSCLKSCPQYIMWNILFEKNSIKYIEKYNSKYYTNEYNV